MPPESVADDARLAATGPALGLDLPPAVRARLLRYLGLIQQWNRVYNLTALREPGAMFTHHLLDCLAIVSPLQRQVASRSHPASDRLQVLDVGSGAGLPGVVLALLRPDWDVTCVDAVAKKAGFIRQVAAELGLPNLQATHGRVESSALWGGRRFDLVTSRAFASLRDFVGLTADRLAPGACWAAMKAHVNEAERAELPPTVELFHVEPLAVPGLDAQRCLVWLRPRPADGAAP